MPGRRTRSLALCLIFLVILVLPSGSALGQETGFGETFDDPALPGWAAQGGAEVVEGRLLLLEGASLKRLEAWSNLEIQGQGRLNGPGELVLKTRPGEANGLSFIIAGSYAALFLEDAPLAEIELETIPQGEWFTFFLQVGSQSARAEINGRMVYQEQLPQELPAFQFGFSYAGPGSAELEFIEGNGTLQQGAQPEDLQATSQPDESGTANEGPGAAASRSPAYQAGSWKHLGGPIGGLGYDIRYSYFDHNLWFVTDAWAGIHRSTDRGLTWQPINNGINASKGVDGVPVFCVTASHLENGVVWIGTEGTGQIYRSQDNGDIWLEMSNGIDPNLRPLTFRGITIHPTDPNTLYAMAEIGSPGWTADGQSRAGVEMDLTKGVVFKTTDGGQNWREVWRGDNLARYAWINPSNPQMVYVSTGIFDRESSNTDVEAGFAGGVGILKTEDGGENWQVIDQQNGLLDLYVGSLYMHPEHPDTLLAAAAQNNWSAMAGEFTGGIFITHDGGQTWKRVIHQSERFGAVEFCEVNPDIAYAASDRAVYRSEDGGESWQRFSSGDSTWGPPGMIAGVPIDMQCDPDNANRIFVNNYGGGNFLSTDGGTTWINASKGYSGALMRHFALVPDQPGWLYLGGRSGVFRSTDGGESWQGTAFPGEQFADSPMNEISSLALNPQDPLWLLTAPNDMSNLTYSLDGGNSWQLSTGLSGSPSTVVFAPSNPGIVYASITPVACFDAIPGQLMQEICANAQNQFFSSSDGGKTWRVPGSDDLPGNGFTVLIVAADDANTIYGGTVQGGYAISRDGGNSWDEATALIAGERPVRTMAVDPDNPANIFVGFDEFGLHQSTDGGRSWRKISAGLTPEANVTSVLFDPTDSRILYLADRGSGVYYSTDKGQSWQPLNDGLSHRTAIALGLSDDGTVLYASIEGAGAYRLGNPPAVAGAESLGQPTPQALNSANAGSPTDGGENANIGQEPSPSSGLFACPSSFLPVLLIGLGVLGRRRFASQAN